MIVSPMEGVHLTPRTFAFSLASQWPWFAGGLITGPLYGWLGYRWRARRSPAAALLAALPVLVEEHVASIFGKLADVRQRHLPAMLATVAAG